MNMSSKSRVERTWFIEILAFCESLTQKLEKK